MRKKRLLCLLLCGLLPLLPLCPAIAENEGEGQTLRAREDGKVNNQIHL